MQIRAADRKDEEMLSRFDRHIRPEELDGCAGICSGTIRLL